MPQASKGPGLTFRSFSKFYLKAEFKFYGSGTRRDRLDM